jgi:hypothetical protein
MPAASAPKPEDAAPVEEQAPAAPAPASDEGLDAKGQPTHYMGSPVYRAD